MKAVVATLRRNKFESYFPDNGKYRRELYPKHLDFFAASARYKEILFMAANRVGKSESGAYTSTCHLTGLYPSWWEGRRFDHPTTGWACGTTNETTRDIVQAKLLGPVEDQGTGMIPAHLIQDMVPKRNGLAGSIETVWVRHVSGKSSKVTFKTYEQGRRSFEGTALDWVWDDEEPPLDVYTEQLYRTVTTRGIIYITFTPLQGMSDVVMGFLEPNNELAAEFKHYVQAGWNDVPHIPEEEKKALIATTPPYQIKARTEGEPSLGAGAIYPIPESEITVPVFAIPDEWPRVYALDVGWNRTAALWLAEDVSTGVCYVYSEHYMAHGEPDSHAAAIKSRGEWIHGVVDPACQGGSQIDGKKLAEEYKKRGLHLHMAQNAVETGIQELWQAMVNGRVKFFANLQNFFSEFRKYHRDEKGHIVKKNDHLCDTARYLWLSGRKFLKVRSQPKVVSKGSSSASVDRGWMV